MDFLSLLMQWSGFIGFISGFTELGFTVVSSWHHCVLTVGSPRFHRKRRIKQSVTDGPTDIAGCRVSGIIVAVTMAVGVAMAMVIARDKDAIRDANANAQDARDFGKRG